MDLTSPVIEQLYQAFSLHRATLRCFCSHCVTLEDSQRLLSKSLRDLTATDLEDYAFSAMTTWGDVDDFKHFLPRLFEIVVAGERALFGLFEIVVKLQYADWPQWPEPEKEAVLNVFDDVWLKILNEPPSLLYWEPSDFLIRLSEFSDSVRRWLDVWCEQDGYRPREQLMRFAYHVMEYDRPIGSCLSQFPCKYPVHAAEMVAWLAREETQSYLDAGLLLPGADDDLADASAVLESWRRSRLAHPISP